MSLRSSVACFSVQNASRSQVRTKVLSKIKFNGAGGTKTYLGLTDWGIHFRKKSAGR
jgi:hypothetical protein